MGETALDHRQVRSLCEHLPLKELEHRELLGGCVVEVIETKRKSFGSVLFGMNRVTDAQLYTFLKALAMSLEDREDPRGEDLESSPTGLGGLGSTPRWDFAWPVFASNLYSRICQKEPGIGPKMFFLG